MQNKTIADYNELDCLRAIVAAQQALLIQGSPVANGTYTVGLGVTQDGTITITNGIITAIQEAQP